MPDEGRKNVQDFFAPASLANAEYIFFSCDYFFLLEGVNK